MDEGASSVWRSGGGWVGHGEAGGARLDHEGPSTVQYSTVQYSTVLDHEGPLVQLVIGQQPAAVQQVVRRLLDRVDLVRGLLELPHLADNVGNLYNTKNIQAFIKSSYHLTILILAKLRSPESVKLAVPSSM